MATMKQIADMAGVSRSTVSFVLNDSPLAKQIPERTHKKVHAAAKKLDYRPNEIAQALITGKTKMLGFVTTQISQQFVSKMLWGAMEAVEQQNYYLKVLPFSSKESKETALDNLIKRRVAAVILQGLDNDAVEWFQEKLLKNRIPCCLLGSSFSPATGIRVVSDDSQGAKSAISYLVEKGHRKIIFLNGQSDWPAFMIRENGAKHRAETCGVELSVIAAESFKPGTQALDDIGFIRDEIVSLLKTHRNDATAIFCANDLLGVLAVQACARLGIKVPEELSIMGFSTSILSEYCDPELSTVVQPHHEMGYEAASELVEVLRKEDSRVFERAIELKLPTIIKAGGTVATI